jgi:hypothetical protein
MAVLPERDMKQTGEVPSSNRDSLMFGQQRRGARADKRPGDPTALEILKPFGFVGAARTDANGTVRIPGLPCFDWAFAPMQR